MKKRFSPVHRGNGHEHAIDQPHRCRRTEEADDHGQPAQELGQGGEPVERGGNTKRLLEVGDGSAAVRARRTAEDLLGAMREEKMTPSTTRTMSSGRSEGAEEHVHDAHLLGRKGDAGAAPATFRACREPMRSRLIGRTVGCAPVLVKFSRR